MGFFNKFKPGIPKRHLLLIAGFVWLFAGGMLSYRGYSSHISASTLDFLEVILCIGIGIAFYFIMFSKISLKHITRIVNIKLVNPCIFSFFNLRSYFLMILMISGGISLRVFHVIDIKYISLFYIVMSTPLLISSFRFFHTYIFYDKFLQNYDKSINNKEN
ncbi:MAG: hypothetical protein HXX09_04115 [Bacteroidetes bacterium]|nr:hypothetical protein [Bacteroidota bacterium]